MLLKEDKISSPSSAVGGGPNRSELTGMKKIALQSRNPAKIYALILIIFTFILYGNTLWNKYSLDDDLVIYKNPTVQKGIKGIPEIFTTFYSEGKQKYEYRPIVKTTFAIEYEVFGENPFISHLINVLLYIATILLIFFLLKKFL